MSRLRFSDPTHSRDCPKCGSFGRMRVQYTALTLTMNGVPADEYLELTCVACGYIAEMECKS